MRFYFIIALSFLYVGKSLAGDCVADLHIATAVHLEASKNPALLISETTKELSVSLLLSAFAGLGGGFLMSRILSFQGTPSYRHEYARQVFREVLGVEDSIRETVENRMRTAIASYVESGRPLDFEKIVQAAHEAAIRRLSQKSPVTLKEVSYNRVAQSFMATQVFARTLVESQIEMAKSEQNGKYSFFRKFSKSQIEVAERKFKDAGGQARHSSFRKRDAQRRKYNYKAGAVVAGGTLLSRSFLGSIAENYGRAIFSAIECKELEGDLALTQYFTANLHGVISAESQCLFKEETIEDLLKNAELVCEKNPGIVDAIWASVNYLFNSINQNLSLERDLKKARVLKSCKKSVEVELSGEKVLIEYLTKDRVNVSYKYRGYPQSLQVSFKDQSPVIENDKGTRLNRGTRVNNSFSSLTYAYLGRMGAPQSMVPKNRYILGGGAALVAYYHSAREKLCSVFDKGEEAPALTI